MMARSPIVAVIMGIIPIVDLYLIYKWWGELKAITKADYSPIVRLILCLIPIVNIYFFWKFMTETEAAAKKKKAGEGYPMGATVCYILCILFSWVLGLPFLYLLYKTQDLLNKAE